MPRPAKPPKKNFGFGQELGGKPYYYKKKLSRKRFRKGWKCSRLEAFKALRCVGVIWFVFYMFSNFY